MKVEALSDRTITVEGIFPASSEIESRIAYLNGQGASWTQTFRLGTENGLRVRSPDDGTILLEEGETSRITARVLTPAGCLDTIEAFLRAVRTGDKETFRSLVSERILARHADNFDAWFAGWQREIPADWTAEDFLREESDAFQPVDGSWKLDEN